MRNKAGKDRRARSHCRAPGCGRFVPEGRRFCKSCIQRHADEHDAAVLRSQDMANKEAAQAAYDRGKAHAASLPPLAEQVEQAGPRRPVKRFWPWAAALALAAALGGLFLAKALWGR